jgi:hypothetical protein
MGRAERQPSPRHRRVAVWAMTILAGMTYTDEDVDDWCHAVADLNDTALQAAHSTHDITHRVALEMSGWGYMDAPTKVIYMIRDAIEAGYAFALRDVREGHHDEQIDLWRS